MENPVPASKLVGRAAQTLLGATVDASDVRCWGSLPKDPHFGTWGALQAGDEVIVYRGKSIGCTHQARVLDKVRDAETARAIWGTDDASGATWELMYFLEVEELRPPRTLEEVRTAFGYKPTWYPLGFRRVDGGALADLVPATTAPSPAATTEPYTEELPVIPRAAMPSAPDPDVVGWGINAHRALNGLLADAVRAARYRPGVDDDAVHALVYVDADDRLAGVAEPCGWMKRTCAEGPSCCERVVPAVVPN